MRWGRFFCMPNPCVALRESSDVWKSFFFSRPSESVCRRGVPSLYSQLNDFILAAIEWAQRCFQFLVSCPWHKYSVWLPHTPVSSHLFPMTVRKPTVLLTLHLVFTFTRKKIQYFEYDACWTRCLNQIYKNTNLHLLSVWRGFPYRNKWLGFPKPKLEVRK